MYRHFDVIRNLFLHSEIWSEFGYLNKSFDQFNNSAQGRHSQHKKPSRPRPCPVQPDCRLADPMRRDASRSRARIFNGEPCQVFLQCRSRGPGGRCHKRIAAGQVYCVHERNGSCRNSGKNHPECSSTWAQRQRSRHATFETRVVRAFLRLRLRRPVTDAPDGDVRK
jgi:hypothetical protein